MRVQPHLPNSPFTATVTSSSGAVFLACSAANSPAPPAPRIRMSVSMRRISTNLRRSDAFQDGVAPARHFFLVVREQRAAMRVHPDQQRPEMPDLESPQALGVQIIEIDVLDLLYPGSLQRRRAADNRQIGATQFLEGGERIGTHAALADNDAHALALHQRPGKPLHALRGGGADAERRVAGRR